jgi:hypothetical protein
MLRWLGNRLNPAFGQASADHLGFRIAAYRRDELEHARLRSPGGTAVRSVAIDGAILSLSPCQGMDHGQVANDQGHEHNDENHGDHCPHSPTARVWRPPLRVLAGMRTSTHSGKLA